MIIHACKPKTARIGKGEDRNSRWRRAVNNRNKMAPAIRTIETEFLTFPKHDSLPKGKKEA
jgi:hypothetical protein